MLPTVPLVDKRVDDYEGPAGREAVARLREAARPLVGASILHLNSTAFGGGVAELLHSQLPLLNDLGIQATWAVLEGSDDYFAVTKAVHNALQGAEVPWTGEMRAAYWERIRANATELTDRFDYVFVHDPQPAALLSILEEGAPARTMGVAVSHRPLRAVRPRVGLLRAFREPVRRGGVHDGGLRPAGLTGPAGRADPTVDRSRSRRRTSGSTGHDLRGSCTATG